MTCNRSTMEQLAAELAATFRQYDYLMENGCQDPFWPDGVNLNLVRNHILYYKGEMEALMKDQAQEITLFAQTYPDIYYRETPEEVPDDLMVKADEIRARAKEQLALYEQNPDFQYIQEAHDKVFPNGETKATKAAGLYIGRSRSLCRYRKDIETDDLVAMRRDFYRPYEEMAAFWAETAGMLRDFLSKDHSQDDMTVIREEYEEDEYEEEDAEYDEADPDIAESPSPALKPSLDEKIHAAKNRTAVAQPEEKKEQQLSMF